MKALIEAVELTKSLIAINSHNPLGKANIIRLVKEILTKQTKAEIIINNDVEPVLIALLKGSESRYCLMLEGHLDVVNAADEMFFAEQKNGVIYGRGSADMKSGCAAIISAFIEASKASSLTHDLLLVLTSDEETTGASIKHLLENKLIPKVDFALIPEPTDLQICNAHKGQAWISMDFFGKAAHSSMPELGINAIDMACDFIYSLRKEYRQHPLYGKETLSIGTIEGGTDPNVVPEHAKLRIDKRYLPNQSIENTLTEIELAIKKCQEQNSNFRAQMTVEGNWSALYTDPEHSDFKRIKKVISKTLNQETELVFWTAWGEGGYINQFDIPTLYFGPGETRFAHTKNEQVNIEQIEKATLAYTAIINTLCQGNTA